MQESYKISNQKTSFTCETVFSCPAHVDIAVNDVEHIPSTLLHAFLPLCSLCHLSFQLLQLGWVKALQQVLQLLILVTYLLVEGLEVLLLLGQLRGHVEVLVLKLVVEHLHVEIFQILNSFDGYIKRERYITFLTI